jgi:hypothetical protein
MRTWHFALAALALGAATLGLKALADERDGELKSGVAKGTELAAYNPSHFAGPDRGTNVCPV